MRYSFISSIVLVSLAICACDKRDVTVTSTVSETSDSFISQSSGAAIHPSVIHQGEILIKVNDAMRERIAEVDANLEILCLGTKAEDEVFSIVKPVGLSRVFPYAGEYEERTHEAGLDRWYRVELPENISLRDAEAAFCGKPGIEKVEFRRQIVGMFDNTVIPAGEYIPATNSAATKVFNDPRLSQQWHYYNDGAQNGMTAGCDVNVLPIWKDKVAGNSNVIVSVVDGGIQYDHPDLAANMWTDPKTGSCGYNFVNNSSKIIAHDHGTHVAGTIAAVNNNGVGVCGIAGGDAAKGVPGVQLMSCQIFMTTPAGDIGGDGAQAIKWGADHGAVISQNSWGYNFDYNDDGMLTGSEYTDAMAATISSYDRDVIDYFIKYAGCDNKGNQLDNSPMKGGIVIFAAGNDNIGNGAPANYAPIFAVGSIGADYRRAYYSNFGSWVDICAPGGDARKGYTILSTIPKNNYGYMQGTSMACPHVSGVAALVLANCGGPGFTNADLERTLLASVNEEVLTYNVEMIGSGLVNAGEAITGSTNTEHTIEPESSNYLSMKPSQTRELVFLVNNPTGHKLDVSITPEINGITLSQDPSRPNRRFIVTVDGKTAVGKNWDRKNEYNMTFSVGCGQEDEVHSCEFRVSIDANQTPIILKPLTGFVANKIGEASSLNLSKYFFDADSDALTYDVSKTNIGKFAIKGGKLIFTPHEYGSDEVEITATDPFGAKVSGKLKLLVRDGSSRTVDMYPNPVKDNLYFRAADSFTANVEVYSASGKCVIKENVDISPFSPGKIDMSALSGGVYSIKLKSDKVEINSTIVKI